MQMLKKIFNSDKKYYLELDETSESKPVQQAAKTVKETADVTQNKVTKASASKPVQQAVETVKETAEVAQDKLQSAATDTKPQAKSGKEKSSKKSVKKKNNAAPSEQKNTVKAQPSSNGSGASSFEPPFWVAAMYKNGATAVNKDGTQSEQTFATDNLMPTITKYRRTPGPSLSKFKDMASKAKTPRR